MADFQSNECITSLYNASLRTHRAKKKIAIWHSSFFFFFLQQTKCNSIVSPDVRLHINPLHYLARSSVCPQMSCTFCLSNNDIQTPDQKSVPCTTPYFHKDTLISPSNSRSPLLEGGGHSTYAARDESLYNARPLLRDLHHAP